MYVAMVRDYWSAVGAALLRTAAHVGIFAIVGRLLAYEWTGVTRVPDPFYTRDSDLYRNTDSSMFLPMACFLDQDLNPLTSLTTSQLDQVGVLPPVALAETWCFIFLSLCYVAAHAAHLFQFKHRYRKDEETLEEAEERAKEEMEGGSDRGCVILYWAAIVGVCMAVIIFCYWHLWILHLWMVKSGWMEDLPGSEQSEEEDLNGIGQLGYLCTLFWVLLLFLDEWRCCVRRRKD
ncbi:hypothetical protein G7054_g12611 [Neopestalotiopsis clavispora]|nr:hypothetical protein G7054_g12611 [Neopestalotiopsis clavispora]